MTELAFKSSMPGQADSLLRKLGDYPNPALPESLGFQPSLLRYKVKTSEETQRKTGYEALTSNSDIVSKVVAVDSSKIWYDDDDWLGDAEKRLGSSETLESIARKRAIQDATIGWCKENNIREHVQEAIEKLCPFRYRAELLRYGVKFDLYTNRTAPFWHPDWDDGHALFVGLINLSKDSSRAAVSIKGAEILDFTRDMNKLTALHAAASSMRSNLMKWPGYEALGQLGEDQPFGEIRWFNDAVLVHRTPPHATNTLNRTSHDLNALNRNFFVGPNPPFDLPERLLSPEMKRSDRYNLNGPAPTASRALLRITVRQWRKHKE